MNTAPAVAVVIRGRDKKLYPVPRLTAAELGPLRGRIHRLHCREGLTVRQVQARLAEQGTRRALGTIARDLRLFWCSGCARRG